MGDVKTREFNIIGEREGDIIHNSKDNYLERSLYRKWDILDLSNPIFYFLNLLLAERAEIGSSQARIFRVHDDLPGPGEILGYNGPSLNVACATT